MWKCIINASWLNYWYCKCCSHLILNTLKVIIFIWTMLPLHFISIYNYKLEIEIHIEMFCLSNFTSHISGTFCFWGWNVLKFHDFNTIHRKCYRLTIYTHFVNEVPCPNFIAKTKGNRTGKYMYEFWLSVNKPVFRSPKIDLNCSTRTIMYRT